jgi:hypothetical protein
VGGQDDGEFGGGDGKFGVELLWIVVEAGEGCGRSVEIGRSAQLAATADVEPIDTEQGGTCGRVIMFCGMEQEVMEFSPMNVEVSILVSSQPTDQNLENLKAAAAELTDDRRSITSTVQECEFSRYELVTHLTMGRSAQYKVVDDIADRFKFHTWDLERYQDMSISFPLTAEERARQQ